MPIQVGGIVSGLETKKIIDQLLEIEKQPITQLQTRQEDYTVQFTAYGLMENKLKTLDTALKTLDATRDFSVYSASSSDEEIFTATASTSAAPGAFDIAVTQLAKSSKLKSAGFSDSEEIVQFTVNSTNKHIDFSENGGPALTATLTEGTYSITELAEEIQTRLDAASAAGGNSYTYGIGYSTATKGFTIESSSSGLTQLDMLWSTGTNAANSAASLLGYTAEDDTGALTYSSDTEVGEGTLHIEIGSTFTIDQNNNKIDFKENIGGGLGAELTATLADGIYTIKEFQAAMETAIEAASTASGNSIDYTVSYDAASQKFSVEENGNSLTELQFLFSSGTNASYSAASTLGFSAVDETGAVTYTAESETATVVDVAVTATDTLEDIATAINDSDAPITATVVFDGTDYILSLSGRNTGEDNVINITATDTDGNNTDTNGLSRLVFDAGVTENMTRTQAARDAIITVDGITGIKRASNTVSDVITGVTLTLKGVHADPLTESDTVTISRDTGAVADKITAFVDAYNDLLDFFSEYQKKYDSEEETAGVLVGDSTTNMIRNTLRRRIGESVSGLDSLSRLSDIGITLNQEDDPRLEVDSAILESMLGSHFDDVESFFSRDTEGAEGFAVTLVAGLGSMTDRNDGILTAKKDGITETIGRLDTKIESLQEKLVTTEATLWKRFNALELILSNFKNTGDYLSQQITSLQNLSSSIYG